MSIEKSPDAYRTISEVSKSMDIPQHVLRFWETKFTQIKPLKRGGGRRYYNPQDVDLLRGIRHLLYVEGFTIKGVQKIIKEQGTKAVISSMQESMEKTQQEGSSSLPHGEEEIEMTNPDDSKAIVETEEPEENFESTPTPDSSEKSINSTKSSETDSEELPKDLLSGSQEEAQSGKTSTGLLGKLMSGKSHSVSPENEVLTKKDMKRLQDTLYQLLECKRILDSTR